MRWELTEPRLGDIIRVKTGSIYHYGIFVSDAEVIQFGLSPALRPGVKDSEVEVCVTDVDGFIAGGFLEVGVPEKKDPKRFSRKKTVYLARMRVGEKGYSLIYNNCEHFANECYYGKKYSSQTDGIRELFRKLPMVEVYVAAIPDGKRLKRVYPKARRAEIKSVKNERVRKEKYYAWKLLEYALSQSFTKKFTDIEFFKSESGKWGCDVCEFSISHSHGAVCVAVSKAPVGVDIELIEKPPVDLSGEILSAAEKADYEACADAEKSAYLLGVWAKKESLFKQRNEKSVTREGFRSLDGSVFQATVRLDGKEYALSVATDTPEKVRLKEGIELV